MNDTIDEYRWHVSNRSTDGSYIQAAWQPTVKERIVMSKLFSQIILNTSVVGLSSTMIEI